MATFKGNPYFLFSIGLQVKAKIGLHSVALLKCVGSDSIEHLFEGGCEEVSFDGGKPLAEGIDEWVKLSLSCCYSTFLSRHELLIQYGESLCIQADLKSRLISSLADLDVEIYHNLGGTFVVGGSEVRLDIAPDVFEVYEVEIESESILLRDQLIFDRISVIAKVDFFVAGVDLVEERKVEPFSAELAQAFIIRFEIHTHDIIIQQFLPPCLSLINDHIFLRNLFMAYLLVIIFIMSYEMKKALRRSAGAKSYAEM